MLHCFFFTEIPSYSLTKILNKAISFEKSISSWDIKSNRLHTIKHTH